MNEFYAREFWRFVNVQQAVAQLGPQPSTIPRCRTRRPSTWRRLKPRLRRPSGITRDNNPQQSGRFLKPGERPLNIPEDRQEIVAPSLFERRSAFIGAGDQNYEERKRQ